MTPFAFYCQQKVYVKRGLLHFPDLEIVVSSTWRDNRDLATLQGFFSPDVARQIIGVTPSWRDLPHLIDVIGQYPRHVEVEGWLRQKERVWEPWVALDNKAYWFKPLLPNLVKCDGSMGLDETTASALRRKLSGR